MEGKLTDLISYIKKHANHPIHFETLDPSLLSQMNDIDDNYLQSFHKNHHMEFYDISGPM